MCASFIVCATGVVSMQIIGHLASSQIARLRELRELLRAAATATATAASAGVTGGTALPGSRYGGSTNDTVAAAFDASAVAALQAEFDELVGAECLYCGQVMIDSVAVPFLDDDGDAVAHEWDI